MAFKITTTGTSGGDTIIFNDLGGRFFTHPTTNYDLQSEFTSEEISKSADVQSALNDGFITAKDENDNPITILVSGSIVPLKGYQETPTVTDGVSTVTLTYAPLPNSETITLRGAIQTPPSSYSISGKIVTFTFPLITGDVIFAKYLY